MMLPHIASRLFNEPLLYDAGKAADLLEHLGGRITGQDLVVIGAAPIQHNAFEGRERLGRVGDVLGRPYDRAGLLPFTVLEGGVALIPIEGTLVHKGAYVGQSSGQTSYQGIQTQVRRAMASSEVKGVLFEVDSFGGEAAGAFETANMIAALSAVKPTIAVLTDFAMSGGILLASAARQIVMPEFGRAGSIGVLRIHADMSGKMEKDGIKVTLITAGKHKADGNSFEALSDDLLQQMQRESESMRQVFADYVGRFRGARFSKQDALDTEADTYRAHDAVKIGMVDAIGDANEVLEAFTAEIKRKG